MKEELENRVVYVRDAPTRMEGRRYRMPPGTELRFSGQPPPLHRRQFTVTNRSTFSVQIRCFKAGADDHLSPELRLGDSGVTADDPGPVGLTVFSSSTVTLFTSAPFSVRNTATSSTAEVDVSEIFYL